MRVHAGAGDLYRRQRVHGGQLNPSTGCVHTPQVGQGCDDDNECTTGEVCDAGGECGGGAPVADCCEEDDDCNQDTLCAPQVCQEGSCVAQPVTCTAPDACQAAACDALTGECVNTPIVCTALDECHVAGTCDPETGQCSNPLIEGDVEIVSVMVVESGNDTGVLAVLDGSTPITVEGSQDNHFVATVNDPELCANPSLEPVSYQWVINTPNTGGYTARGIQGMDTPQMFVAADSIPNFIPLTVGVTITVSRASTGTEVTAPFRIRYINSSLTDSMSTTCQTMCTVGPGCDIAAALKADCP